MPKTITNEFLKRELTREQYVEYIVKRDYEGEEAAIDSLPDFGDESFKEIKGIEYTLNNHIKQLRLENGLSQTDLANVLNVTQREYWRYEQNGYKPRIDKLTDIAIFYNVSLDWITGIVKEKRTLTQMSEEDYIWGVNGYNLFGMKEAKENKERYIPFSWDKYYDALEWEMSNLENEEKANKSGSD